MTQTIAPPQARPAPSASVARIALALVAAVLLVSAFATGRATAPEPITRTVVSTPADVAPAASFDCPPSRPPIC